MNSSLARVELQKYVSFEGFKSKFVLSSTPAVITDLQTNWGKCSTVLRHYSTQCTYLIAVLYLTEYSLEYYISWYLLKTNVGILYFICTQPQN